MCFLSLQVVESEDTIILENVPIVTPNRDIVASGLTFRVRPHILCTSRLFVEEEEEEGGKGANRKKSFIERCA